MSELPHVWEVESENGDYSAISRDSSAQVSAVKADELNVAVKKTGNSKGTGHNKPLLNSKLPALAMLCFTALLLLASCGGEQPARPQDTPIPEVPSETPPPAPMTPTNPSPTPVLTPTVEPPPAATGVAMHAVTEASDDERENDNRTNDNRTKVAVQQLFDTWNRALKEDDAALFHSILTRELAESCGLDELQSWLEQDEEFFAETVVTAVFLDVTDPTRAFAELVAGQRAGRPQEAISFPWPVESWKTENGGQDSLLAWMHEDAPTSQKVHARGRKAGSANSRRFPAWIWTEGRRFLPQCREPGWYVAVSELVIPAPVSVPAAPCRLTTIKSTFTVNWRPSWGPPSW